MEMAEAEEEEEETDEFDFVGALWDGKPNPVGEEEDNQLYAMISEILIGFGLLTFVAGWATQNWLWYPTWIGFAFTILGLAPYVWGLLKWNDARVEPTAGTAFRSWRINFISFWVAIGVALINGGLAWLRTPFQLTFLAQWGMIIASCVGIVAIGGGVFMGWFMKNLWFNYDPEGALADEEFNYFQWNDREDPDAIFRLLAKQTAV